VRTLNLGILAHVDAGKTSLTERLLFAAGVIDAVGSVDDGSTQTDSLALEQQRGITIKSAVVSFVVDDVAVNLIDTPGHPDFIAEVERALGVLDGVVLVVSAVEGVQAQTRVLMRALKRLSLPTIIFVNKIDRRGASPDRVLQEIADRLTPAVIPLGSVQGPGTRDADYTPYPPTDAAFTARLAELLADRDEQFLAAYLNDPAAVTYDCLRCELARQTRHTLVQPVFFGSAITGAGVDALIAGLMELLPATEGDVDAAASGAVFKVERGPSGEKVAYLRLFSGTVRVRDRLRLHHTAGQHRGQTISEQKITAISVFERGAAVQRASVSAGQIGKLWGLADVQVGDMLGSLRATTGQHQFAAPTLESVIVPCRAADRGALHMALAQLAEQDPLINLRQDDTRHELFVSLYGEVQKEVIQTTLANDFNIATEFRETTTICIERPVGTGEAVEVIAKDGNPFIATVGLRVEAAPVTSTSGIEFQLAVDVRLLPLYVYKSVEEFRAAMTNTVRETLSQGIHGWRVTDCLVTMTYSGYISPLSTARDFRLLTPVVLMRALQQAGTAVCEPMHRFSLGIPADTFGAIASVLARLRAVPDSQELRGSTFVLEGTIPAARVHELHQQLPGLTRGEGVLESVFDSYQPVHSAAPSRPRTDHNPLNRKEYLLHVLRRV
jgi:ribosomal protection tetracycline resistance protein